MLKFQRYDITMENRIWTNQKIGAAKRALKKERERAGLFGEELMRFKTVEERMEQMDQQHIDFAVRMRNHEASVWINARKVYRSLPSEQQIEIREFWNASRYPKKSHCFADLLTQILRNPNHIKQLQEPHELKDWERKFND